MGGGGCCLSGVGANTPPPSFGQIRFIRMLPERRCAFINYTRKKAAEAAYAAMQVSWGWAPCPGPLQPLRAGGGGRGALSWAQPPPPPLSLPPSPPLQDAEVEGSRLALQLKHPSHATPSPRQHLEPRGKAGAPLGGLL